MITLFLTVDSRLSHPVPPPPPPPRRGGGGRGGLAGLAPGFDGAGGIAVLVIADVVAALGDGLARQVFVPGHIGFCHVGLPPLSVGFLLQRRHAGCQLVVLAAQCAHALLHPGEGGLQAGDLAVQPLHTGLYGGHALLKLPQHEVQIFLQVSGVVAQRFYGPVHVVAVKRRRGAGEGGCHALSPP